MGSSGTIVAVDLGAAEKLYTDDVAKAFKQNPEEMKRFRCQLCKTLSLWSSDLAA